MNSKAIKRQLLAAIAMVLVAALALGSSTYAWFVASSKVDAVGMSVKAQAEGNLVIRHTTKMWSTVADAGMTKAGSLSPASTADLENWVHASAKTPGSFAANEDGWEDITTSVQPTQDDGNDGTLGSKYVVVKQFFIRAATNDEANAPRGLYVDNIAVTVGNSAPIEGLSSSLRVGVKCTYGDEGGSFIYAPVTTTDNPAEYGVISATDVTPVVRGVHLANGSTQAVTLNTVGESDPLLDDSVTLPRKSSATDVTAENAAAVEVMVYIWFEGEDTNLYSDNYATEDLDVSITFGSLAVGPISGGTGA